MSDCCTEYTDLEGQILEDTTTICGATLSAFDLSTLLSTSELSDNPQYEILFKGGNYVEDISLNGSNIEVELKNPDERPYTEVITASLIGDTFKYKVSIKIKFLNRCVGPECPQGQTCDPCTGDCVDGVVDASISIIDPLGTADVGISIQ